MNKPCLGLIILDRDGVINEDSDAYIKSESEWSAIEGSIQAIAALSKAGYIIAIATNQSGLARQLFNLSDLYAMHQKLCRLVEEQGGEIATIKYCSHLPDAQCACRKPKTGLIDDIRTELQLEPCTTYFVGDSLKDLQAAKAAACVPILVKTGKGNSTLNQLGSEFSAVKVYDDLLGFSKSILV